MKTLFDPKYFLVSIFGLLISQSMLAENYDYEELFWKARSANQYHVIYSDASAQALHKAYIPIELNDSINKILAKIKQPDAEFQVKLDNLRQAYEGLEQIGDPEKLTFDLWEGHEQLPVPGGEEPNGYESAQAVLADTDGFRPFISDFRVADPANAKGTLIAVPSIRASYSELTALARIFNKMNYNVFTVLPRLDMIGGMQGLNWIMLQLDAQRAIRFVKYHAEAFNLDPDKLFLIAGSKGNISHATTFEYFDMTPVELAEARGTTLADYTPDAIDNVPSTVNVGVISYGTLVLGMFNQSDITEAVISKSRIYSKENFDKGYRFPNIVLLAGNLDWDAANLPSAIKAFYDFNNREDKLYTVDYEAHLLNGIPHGFGAGVQYPNLTAQWQQIDVFFQQALLNKEK